MEQSQNTQNTKTVLLVVAILLVLGASYLLLGKERIPGESSQQVPIPSDNQKPVMVVVKNTPMINGAVSAPVGFPQDVPLENGSLIESATTEYPRENAQQLSLSYQSSKTIAEKYAEYKKYMTASGYKITEGGTNSPVRAIFGTREDANLSVVISRAEGKTLVQLSYLLK